MAEGERKKKVCALVNVESEGGTGVVDFLFEKRGSKEGPFWVLLGSFWVPGGVGMNHRWTR